MIELLAKQTVNKNVIVRQYQMNVHKLELLMAEQRIKKINVHWQNVFYRLMEIEAETYCLQKQNQQLLDLYFEVIKDY